MPEAVTIINPSVEADLCVFPGREEWLAGRAGKVGASLVPAIMGVDPWTSPMEAWEKLTGRATPQETTNAMELGIDFEEYVLKRYIKNASDARNDLRTEFKIIPVDVQMVPFSFFQRKDNPRFIASLDAFDPVKKICVNAKTTKFKSDEWGEDFTDQAPLHYIYQFLWEMYVIGQDWRWHHCPVVFREMPDYGFYQTERDVRADKVIENIVKKVTEFLTFVDADDPPPLDWHGMTMKDNMAVMEYLYRHNTGKVVEADAEQIDIINSYEQELAQMNSAEESIETLKARLRETIGENKGVIFNGITYTRQSKENYEFDEDGFFANEPTEISERYRLFYADVKRMKKLEKALFAKYSKSLPPTNSLVRRKKGE